MKRETQVSGMAEDKANPRTLEDLREAELVAIATTKLTTDTDLVEAWGKFVEERRKQTKESD